jgi:hypothetical protein
MHRSLFPAILPFLKRILEVVFCESVQHHMRFCLDHFNCVKMAIFQSYLQSEEQRKVEWVGVDGHVVFGQKFPGEKGSVKCHVVLMKQLVLLSPKFGGDIFAHLHAVAVTMRN